MEQLIVLWVTYVAAFVLGVPFLFARRPMRLTLLVAGFQRLQCPQDLRHGNPARGRRWHAADLPLFVVGAQRCALLGGVALEVGLGQAAGIAMALYLACDFIGNRALV